MMKNRPIFDRIRSRLGYRFPKLGPVAFKLFYYYAPKRCRVEIFPNIFIEAHFDDLTHRATYWQGIRYESPTSNILCFWMDNPHSTAFFDIGANYGFYSYLVLSRFSQDVYAFDPNPSNYQQLLTAKSQNRLENFYPQNIGLSDKADLLTIHYGFEDLGHSTFLPHPALANAPVSTSQVLRFDDWVTTQTNLPSSGSCGWIAKIDVEGFELKVLHGMGKSLREKKFRGLIVEINPYTLALASAKPGDIFQFLGNCGYVPYQALLKGKKRSLKKSTNTFFIPKEED